MYEVEVIPTRMPSVARVSEPEYSSVSSRGAVGFLVWLVIGGLVGLRLSVQRHERVRVVGHVDREEGVVQRLVRLQLMVKIRARRRVVRHQAETALHRCHATL